MEIETKFDIAAKFFTDLRHGIDRRVDFTRIINNA